MTIRLRRRDRSAGEETLVDAINRLRRQGFTLDFYATAKGHAGRCAGAGEAARSASGGNRTRRECSADRGRSDDSGRRVVVFTIRGTKKFLDRIGRPMTEPPPSSTVLGDWYANVLFWRPQVALFVNAATFVPVLMPLAPGSGVAARFPAAMAEVIGALGVDPRFVESEVAEMKSVVLAKAASRQVLSVMNEFVFMAEHRFGTGRSDPADLVGLSVWLANTIVGPISKDDGYTPVGVLQRFVAAALSAD